MYYLSDANDREKTRPFGVHSDCIRKRTMTFIRFPERWKIIAYNYVWRTFHFFNTQRGFNVKHNCWLGITTRIYVYRTFHSNRVESYQISGFLVRVWERNELFRGHVRAERQYRELVCDERWPAETRRRFYNVDGLKLKERKNDA